MEENKKLIDKYYQKNYSKLKEIAGNCLKKIRMCDEELQITLVGDAYCYLIQFERVFKDEGEMESIIVNYILRQVMWSNTPFKKLYIYPQFFTEKFHDFKMIYEDEKEENEKKETKIIWLEEYYKKLDSPKQILFALIFFEGYNSCDKLSTYLKITRNAAYMMKKNMLKDIRDKYSNNNNL